MKNKSIFEKMLLSSSNNLLGINLYANSKKNSYNYNFNSNHNNSGNLISAKNKINNKISEGLTNNDINKNLLRPILKSNKDNYNPSSNIKNKEADNFFELIRCNTNQYIASKDVSPLIDNRKETVNQLFEGNKMSANNSNLVSVNRINNVDYNEDSEIYSPNKLLNNKGNDNFKNQFTYNNVFNYSPEKLNFLYDDSNKKGNHFSNSNRKNNEEIDDNNNEINESNMINTPYINEEIIEENTYDEESEK